MNDDSRAGKRNKKIIKCGGKKMKMKGVRIILAICLFLALAAQGAGTVVYPDPVGRVNDYAGVLTPSEV